MTWSSRSLKKAISLIMTSFQEHVIHMTLSMMRVLTGAGKGAPY